MDQFMFHKALDTCGIFILSKFKWHPLSIRNVTFANPVWDRKSSLSKQSWENVSLKYYHWTSFINLSFINLQWHFTWSPGSLAYSQSFTGLFWSNTFVYCISVFYQKLCEVKQRKDELFCEIPNTDRAFHITTDSIIVIIVIVTIICDIFSNETLIYVLFQHLQSL